MLEKCERAAVNRNRCRNVSTFWEPNTNILKTHPTYWRSNRIGSWKSSWIVAHWCCLPIASLIWMSICLETCRSVLAVHLSKPTAAKIYKSGVRHRTLQTQLGTKCFLWAEMVTKFPTEADRANGGSTPKQDSWEECLFVHGACNPTPAWSITSVATWAPSRLKPNSSWCSQIIESKKWNRLQETLGNVGKPEYIFGNMIPNEGNQGHGRSHRYYGQLGVVSQLVAVPTDLRSIEGSISWVQLPTFAELP